jgi:formylglycine-generating enzyme required for sulfatase activity
MRGVKYIREEPKIPRPSNRPEPLVVASILLACGVFAWLSLRGTGEGLSHVVIEEAGAVKAAMLQPAGQISNAPGGIVRDCASCPEMVVVPTGFFTVGARDDDAEARPQEKPRRSAAISRPYAVGRYETTVREFKAFSVETGHALAACSGEAGQPEQPQRCVSFEDAAAYAQWVSRKTGERYRLPTADEWEYAAGAHGMLAPQPASELKAVTETAANGFGLYGMRGNVAEIVSDCWVVAEGEKLGMIERDDAGRCIRRTVKDGSWLDSPREARLTAKRAIKSDLRSERVGFRLVREMGN